MEPGYYEAAASKPLHPLYDHLELVLPRKGRALDLGCGVGHATLWLASKGFDVTAIDHDPRALETVRASLPAGASVQLIEADFTEFPEGAHDVIIAGFSLFFVPSEKFLSFWQRMTASLVSGGLFAGQLLGPNDDWAEPPNSWHSRAQVEELFDQYQLLTLEEVERDGKTLTDQAKHWHIFHVIARKKG